MKKTILYALCVIALVGCSGSVQEEPKSQFALDFPFDIAIGITDEKQESLENYSSRFQPAGGSMNVPEEQPGVSFAFGLQPELRQYVGSGWIVGALAKYQFRYPGDIDEYVSVDMLDWWDPVIARAIALRRSPSAGLLIGTNAPHYQQFRMQVTSFYYSLAVMEFEGVDLPDERNMSRSIDRHELSSGFGFGLGFDFRPPWTNTNYGRIGVYWDHAWSAWSMGIGWRFTTPMYASKSTIPKIE